MSLFFWLSGLKRRLSPSANVPSTRSTRRSSRSSQPALRSATVRRTRRSSRSSQAAAYSVERLESRQLLTMSTAGFETLVNTTTAGNQSTNSSGQGGSTAMDADGDYVVTWTSNGQDGSLAGVYARRYNAAGQTQGLEFQVNTYTTGDQKNATVAMDAAGDFVVTWTSYDQDGEYGGVYAQRYNAAGVVQGGEFQVNTTTTGNQDNSTVAMDAAGDFVVTWTSYGQEGAYSENGVYAQRYNAAGVVQGGEFQVNTYTTNDQKFSTVAMDADGDFVVTWSSYDQGGDRYDVYAQRYNAAGGTQGDEFLVNTIYYNSAGLAPHNSEFLSTVAMDADGDFVVTWTSYGQEGSSYGVYAKRYDAAGDLQGDEFQVNTTTVGSQIRSTVAMDADGDFVVTWTSYDGYSDDVYAQRYNAAGEKQLGEVEFRVNTTATNTQRDSTVAMDADGDFVVTWNSYNQDGDGQGVYAQRYNESTDNAGPIVAQVFDGGRQIAPGDQLVSVVPALTVVFSENLNVTGGTSGANSVTNTANWVLTRNGVDVTSTISGITFGLNTTTNKYEALLTFSTSLADGVFQLTARATIQDSAGNALDGDSNGTPGGDFTQSFSIANIVTAGTEFRVNTATAGSQTTNTGGVGGSIAMDADGDYVVTWTSYGSQDGSLAGVYARRYNAAGETQGDEFQVNKTTTGNQSDSTVAMDADGDFVVTWTSYGGQDGSLSGVYAKRYNAAGQLQLDEFLVNTTTASSQFNSTVAMDADGDFVVTWTSDGGQDGSLSGVYAKRYNAAGQLQLDEFRVNTTTASSQNGSTVAMDADGDFVVTWTSYGSQDGSLAGVYAKRYNAAGQLQLDEFLVNTTTASSQFNSTVAMDADGDFVVTWTSDGGQDGSLSGVYAQRYNAAGAKQGGEILVNTTTASSQKYSTVAMDADGDFVVTWSSSGQDGSFYGVYAQRYNAAGVKQGGEFQVNTYTTSEQFQSTVAMDAAGDFVVTWSSYGQDGSLAGVYARRYQTNMSPVLAGPAAISLTDTSAADTFSAQTGSLRATDADQPAQTLTYGITGGTDNGDGTISKVGTYGTLTVTVADGSYSYAPNATAINGLLTNNVDNFSVTASDGSLSDTQTLTVNITAANDTPLLANIETTALPYVPNTAPTLITSMLSLTDADTATMIGATIQITGGYHSGDVLAFTNTSNITGVWDGSETLTLTGSDTVANYEAALRAVTYQSSSASELARTISFQVNDGSSVSNIATRLIGGEVLVNTTTAGNQTTNNIGQGGSIAMDADGDYVVTWTSNGQDAASSDGVYAQRYNAAGVAQGDEFQVNTYTTGNQKNSTVAMDAAGDFVVTWSSRNQDGDDYGVYAQRYNAAGVAQGGEFRVNTTTANIQRYSTVAMDADGDFVVTWSSYGQDGRLSFITNVYAQRYNAAGVAQGVEFQVNTYTTGLVSSQKYSTVAMDASGDFVVTWSSYGQDGSENGVYAQRYNAAGVVQGDEFQVNTTATSSQKYATVAMDADGDFVVTWTSYGDQDGSASGVYAQRYNAAGVVQGGEFQVNTYTTNDQKFSTVAMDADGDFVVTWSSYDQGGDRYDVYAQRYNAAGDKQGDEFRVNTHTTNDQKWSTVAMDADGDFVVTWRSNGQDGDGQGVYVQRYDESTDTAGPIVAQVFDGGRQIAAGDQLVSVVPALTVVFSENLNVAGGASGANSVTNTANWVLTRNGVDVTSTISGITFGLNTTTNKYEALLTMSTSLADGVFQLTARQTIQDLEGNALDGDSNGAPGGNFTQSFSIANIVTAGTEFLVNTTTANSQRTKGTAQGGSIAMDADGDYVVTWTSAGQDGDGLGVYAQRYNAAGAKRGDEFQVNTTTAGDQSHSTVAMDADGDFVVTWTSFGQDGDADSVYAKRYNAAGDLQGDEFRVNETTVDSQRYSTVAMDASGDFVVTWSSQGQDGSSYGVYAKRYNAAGDLQGDEFQVNTYTTGNQMRSTVALDASGDFVVTWSSFGQDASDTYGVYAQRYNAAGVAQGGEFRVNSTTAGTQRLSTVALDASGDFVVTWTSYGDQDGSISGVYAQRYNAVGDKQGGEFQVNTYTESYQNDNSVAMDADGDFVVTWSSYYRDGNYCGVYAQRYNAAGVAQGGEFLVNTYTGSQRWSTVAMDADGDFVVTWSSDGQDGDGLGVYAQRYETDMSPVLAAPEAINLTDTSAADTFSAQTGSLSATDADLPAQSLTYGITGGTDNGDGTISQVGTYGTLTVTVATGAYSYAPNATAINGLLTNNVDNFSVTASDGSLSDTKTLAVNLTAANDTPVATTGSFTAAADVSLSGSLASLVSDVDTATADLSYSQVGGPLAGLTLNSDGTFTYLNPTANFNGTVSFQYQVSDGSLSSTPQTITISVTEVQPPTSNSLSPVDGATGVAVGANLVVTFSENVQKGTGNIVIKKSSDNSIFATIDVTDAHVSVSGAVVTINPTADLEGLTGYYVQIDTGAIEDTSGNDFAGINDTTTWNFTTVDVVASSVVIIDNGDAGFSAPGYTTAVGEGFQNDIAYAAASGSSSVATWTFNGLATGIYRVSATWNTLSNRATNSPFTVYNGATSLSTLLINQKLAPNDRVDAGVAWEDLGSSFSITGTTLVVKLTNAANEYVIADGIRIERIGDLAPPTVFIIDNGDAGFSAPGYTTAVGEGFQNDIAYAAVSDGSSVATWTFNGLATGMYRVSATWNMLSNRATNSPFTVYNGATSLSTLLINQKLAPNDRVDAGIAWEDLGSSFSITGTTLVVKLTNAANEYVIADSIRIERVGNPAPEVTVLDGSSNIADDTGSINFGTTAPGSPLQRTFTVKNDGGAAMTLQPVTGPGGGALPTGFSMVTNISANTVVAPGGQVTFVVRLDAATLGAFSGTLSFVNTDSDEDPFDFTISGTVAAAASVFIIDNGDSGFSAPGYTTAVGEGSQNDIAYAAAGGGSSVATWTFNGLATGIYRVSATWNTLSNRASNSPFTVYNGATSLSTLLINQKLAPNDRVDAGVAWADLGSTFSITGTTLVVKLTNAANEYVIADGIRIERIGDLGAPSVFIIDNGDSGFSAPGYTTAVGEGFQNDIAYAAASGSSSVATWTFNGLATGIYRVSATWNILANRATNSPFTVYNGATSLSTLLINQELAPNDRVDAGVGWEDLGSSFAITGSTLVVKLTNAANEYVIADGIRIERIGDLAPASVFIIDNGDAGFSAPGYTTAVGEGFQNDIAYAAAGGGSSVATWTFNGLATGTYRVSATWNILSNRATNSPFTVYNGTTSLSTVLINQELAPNDRVDAGVAWEDLGSSFSITGTTLVVKLTNAANEYVIADGIRIERLSPLLAAGGAIAGSSAGALTNLGLQPIVAAAITRLEHEGFDPQVLSRVVFTIEDLPGATLGVAGSQAISIDANAAGHGWFIDATPLDDHEFIEGTLPLTTMDLLSVVMHELGHTAGLVDLYDPDHADELMAGFLQAGTRHDAGSEHAGSGHAGSEQTIIPSVASVPVASVPVATKASDLFAIGDAVVDVSRYAIVQKPVSRLSSLIVKVEDPDMRQGFGPLPESDNPDADLSSAAIDELFLGLLDPANAFDLFA